MGTSPRKTTEYRRRARLISRDVVIATLLTLSALGLVLATMATAPPPAPSTSSAKAPGK